MSQNSGEILVNAGYLKVQPGFEGNLHRERSEVKLEESHLPHTTTYEFSHTKNWGTLRPHLYFGLKAKHVESPLFGLIWYRQPKAGEEVVLRHWCGNRDPVVFLWHDHDGKSFGRQRINDGSLTFNTNWFNTAGNSCLVNLDIFSSNQKVSGFKIGGGDANDNLAEDDCSNAKEDCYGFIFYFALQNCGAHLKPSIVPKDGELRIIEWVSNEFGKLSMIIKANALKSENNFSYLFNRNEPHMDMTTVDDVIRDSLERGKNGFLRLKNNVDGMKNPNFAAIQILVREGENIDVKLQSNGEQLPKDFLAEFDPKVREFRKKFDSAFPVNNIENHELYKKIARHALSNLLGGIGFWHGNTPCLLHSGDIKNYGPLNLFSAVPSRPYFPRGFLWDEGFHQLLIRHIDQNLSMEIVGAWLDTMNEQGWIPREQALDTEAKARFPPGFWMESDVANPPMFFYLMDKYLKNPELRELFTDRIRLLYPKLKKLYLWLRRTQAGPLPGTLQWQGRDAKTNFELNPSTLPSGFDDLPRASHPSPEEYHLDIRCWMAFSSVVLHDLAIIAEDTDWLEEIQNDVVYFNDLNTLDALHWSEAKQQYCDFGLHSLDLKMVPKEMPDGSEIMVREIREEPQLRLIEDVNGYANLFPLLMKMLPPESDKLEPLLRSIRDPEDFWTPFGLRSLSTRGPYYNAWNNKAAYPYWRGPIWINMNYFALESLQHYAKLSKRYGQLCAEIYGELRMNVLENIARQYEETGFFWEHYSDRTGEGHGTRPFTGWTTLFVLILAEKYD